MGQIRIWWDDSVGAYRFSSPYKKEMVNLFTTLVPFSERSWDPQSKIWTITEQAMPVFKKIAEEAFKCQATVVTKAQAQQASAGSASSTSRKDINEVIVEFLRLLPHEAAQKAYRHAALLLHPDRGGDMTKMSTINMHWKRIEKEVYGRE